LHLLRLVRLLRIRHYQQLPCFLALGSYDIRVIVYFYFETGPPLAPRIDTLGLYLACHQIKDEIDKIACKELNPLCINIQKTSHIDLAFKLDPENFRHVTSHTLCFPMETPYLETKVGKAMRCALCIHSSYSISTSYTSISPRLDAPK
jgi:hypothetical protein